MRYAHGRPELTLREAIDRLLGDLRTHRFGHGTETASDAHADVLAAIEQEAASIHDRLAHESDVFAAEFLGATGSGKTEIVEVLLDRRSEGHRAAVIAGDVAGDDDARRYRKHGVRAIDVTTGKDCHLDPERVGEAIDELDLEGLDTLFIENVGNMVCPADFPLGATLRVVVVSVTEGEDVVRKHPILFQACDIAVINKTDIADAVGTDVERMRRDVRSIAPEIPVLTTSAATGDGIDELQDRLEARRGSHDHGTRGDGH